MQSCTNMGGVQIFVFLYFMETSKKNIKHKQYLNRYIYSYCDIPLWKSSSCFYLHQLIIVRPNIFKITISIINARENTKCKKKDSELVVDLISKRFSNEKYITDNFVKNLVNVTNVGETSSVNFKEEILKSPKFVNMHGWTVEHKTFMKRI